MVMKGRILKIWKLCHFAMKVFSCFKHYWWGLISRNIPLPVVVCYCRKPMKMTCFMLISLISIFIKMQIRINLQIWPTYKRKTWQNLYSDSIRILKMEEDIWAIVIECRKMRNIAWKHHEYANQVINIDIYLLMH